MTFGCSPNPKSSRLCTVANRDGLHQFDGAFYPATGQGATGAVIRDQVGSFRYGAAKWHAYGLDALTMEAIACREGVVLARNLGIQNLRAETDSQELVKYWEM